MKTEAFYVIRNKQGLVRTGWKILGFAILVIACFFLSMTAGVMFPSSRFLNSGYSTIFASLFGISLFALTVLCLCIEGKSRQSIGLCLDARRMSEFIVGFVLGMVMLLAQAVLLSFIFGFHWERSTAIGFIALLSGLYFFFWSACCEELIFRGYAFQRIVEGLGVWPAQILIALTFGIYHWFTWGVVGVDRFYAILTTGLASIFFGLAFLKTGSLALPIGLHLGWNWVQANLLDFSSNPQGLLTPVMNDPATFSEGTGGLLARLPSLLIVAIGCICLMQWKGYKGHAYKDGFKTSAQV